MENFLTQKGYNIDSFSFKPDALYDYLYEVDREIAIPSKAIIFFDLTGKSELNIFYSKNHFEFNEQLNKIDYRFVFLPVVDFPTDVESAFDYIIPHLKGQINFASYAFENIINRMSKEYTAYIDDYKSILNYLGYRGNIQTGFAVYVEGEVNIIEYSNNEITDSITYLQNSIIEAIIKAENSVFHSRHSRHGRISLTNIRKKYEDSLREKLDEKSLKFVLEISEKIEKLKKSGQILYALPLLQKALKEVENQIDITSPSEIKIDGDFNIILPGFNDLIIPLSHLSKVVYIFFTKHPEGIDIKKLEPYEKELLQLYLSISPQENYDKMVNSIKELVSDDSKAIYTHISRIKSTFYQIMNENFAENYIITGNSNYGSSVKFIPIIKVNPNEINTNLPDDFDVMDFG